MQGLPFLCNKLIFLPCFFSLLQAIGAYIPEIYGVAYTASKYDLSGYSEALREELSPWPGIAEQVAHVMVSLAKPAPVTDGALFQPMEIGTVVSGGWRSPKERTTEL